MSYGQTTGANSPIDRQSFGESSSDILWEHLKRVPTFRALLRSVEARFYQHIDLPRPILDLGCGDGVFAELTFNQPIDVGIDPWWGPLNKASRSNAYGQVVQGSGDQMPFPDNYFGSVISNSVLEHIDRVQSVLDEVSRVLMPGGRLVVTMPTHYFTEFLGGAQLLEKTGSSNLADGYRKLFNRISRHEHTDPPEQWAWRFSKAGLVIEQWQYYFSAEALHTLELGHVYGIPSALCHFLTGHWIIAPWESNLQYSERWIRPYFDEAYPTRGTMALYLARKTIRQPVEAYLPQPIAFDLSTEPESARNELENSVLAETFEEIDDNATIITDIFDSELGESDDTFPLDKKSSSGAPIWLFMLSVLFVVFGQLFLRGEEANIGLALICFTVAIISLYGLKNNSWLPATRVHFGKISTISKRRWFVLLGLILSVFAYNLANVSSPQQRPYLALVIWFGAICAGIYGLWESGSQNGRQRQSLALARWEILSLACVLFGALFVRTLLLTSHPFILSGSEASIGLEAQAAVNGQIRSPFATGWLTNPTLPFYLLGIPLQVLGRSLLSIRILSPLLGMLGVGLTLLVGRWMFGTAIGLVAAILLAGSHIHVHYSRIGLTNIWDPFFVLLSLGLFYLAWLRGDRQIWTMAGIAIGLSAYFYTSSHLLPLILLGLLFVILLKWSEFRPDIRHLLAALLVAFIVALPQMLHYNAYPSEFWDRFMSQGIFQGNWLLNEVIVNGTDTGTILRDQFVRGILSFHSGIDNSNNYFSGRSILGFWVSSFLLIGLGLALVRAKQVRFILLLIWHFVVLVFASALLIDPPSSHRLLIASPAVYLLVALSLSWGIQYIFKFARINQRFLLPVLVLIAILLSLLDLGFYFGTYRAENRFGDRNTEIAFEMSEYLNSLEGEWTVYFYGAPSMFSSFPTFAYLVEDWQTGINMVDVPKDAPLPKVVGDGNSAHLFVPERASELSEVQQNMPGGVVSFFDGHFADPLFFSYSVQQ